jgi:hypothetical protein
MSAEAVKELWTEFDDLASKSQNEDVQFSHQSDETARGSDERPARRSRSASQHVG